MYRVKEYVCPQTVEECARLLRENKRSRLIGGNLFLRMTSIEIPLAIDLSGCGLDYIVQDESGLIRLGAMCSLHALETSPILQDYAGGIISRSAGEIIGVQFRNLATVGASVASKYGFSDVITPLLACGARVRLHEQGELSLEEFLRAPPQAGCADGDHSAQGGRNGRLLQFPRLHRGFFHPECGGVAPGEYLAAGCGRKTPLRRTGL